MQKILIVYSLQDNVSIKIAQKLLEAMQFEHTGLFNGMQTFKRKNVTVIELKDKHIFADFLTDYPADYIIFLSKHTSSRGVVSFTTHSEGNWSSEAKLGGKPYQLSVSSPLQMLFILSFLNKLSTQQTEVTYEATHHGPLLKTPSMFVEIGGTEEAMLNETFITSVAKSVMELVEGAGSNISYNKVVLGIGSSHYPKKFSAMALEKGYAFSHIMPRYYTSEYEMLQQAYERSYTKPELAVIEWKSIKSKDRDKIIKKLDDIGLDYEKV